MDTPALSLDGVQRLWKTRYGITASVSLDSLAARSLHNYGEWVEQELDLLSGLVQEGHSVLEFGGDYGAHALWLSRTVGEKGQVHVAEPRRLEFQQLCANVALNGLINVHTHSVWLGRESATTRMLDARPNRSGNDGERVRCASVDSLGLDALHLIKVNLPGTLVALLQGADESVRRFRPTIYVRLGGIEQAAAEVKALKDAGYRCWSHLPYLYSADNHAGNSDNLFPGMVHQNVIAAPIEARLEFDRLREI